MEGPATYTTVFKITPGGALTLIHSFCDEGVCPYGAEPAAGRIQAADGDFYGTTEIGGAHGGGTIFKITPTGALSTVYRFCAQSGCADCGGSPHAGGRAYDIAHLR